jgi:hypothetical protein
MPSLPSLTRQPKIDESAVYQCIGSHISKAGSFTEDMKLRGSHAGVQASPTHWARADLADDELNAAKVALQYAGDLTHREAYGPGRLLEEIPPERRYRVTRTLPVNSAGSFLEAGRLVDSKDPTIAKIMKANPTAFAPDPIAK